MLERLIGLRTCSELSVSTVRVFDCGDSTV